MKIGIDARFYGSLGKGLGRYTEKLITYLEAVPGDACTYVVFLRRENFDEYKPKNPRFTKVMADYPWYGWREQLLFPLQLRRFKFDLIHFPHFNVPILVPAPFTVTVHDLILFHFPTVKASELSPFLYWLKYVAYRIVITLAIRRARAIIAVSEFTRTDICSTYRWAALKTVVTLEAAESSCFWTHPSVERELLRALGLFGGQDETGSDQFLPFVLYVGNAYPHKNLELLLSVAPAMPDVVFLCVGKEDFFYHSFRKQVTAAGVSNIRFAGYIDDRSVGVLYRRARAYLFPSFYEGFGLPGLEAMNYGLPVVAARAGSLPEIYARAAVYFNPRDGKACIHALQQAFESERTKRHRQLGFDQASRFSWERMAFETSRLYKNCLSKKY